MADVAEIQNLKDLVQDLTEKLDVVKSKKKNYNLINIYLFNSKLHIIICIQ